MPAWIWITCGAALAQTLRFMLQKHLAGGVLSASGATFARFVYSAPIVAVGVMIYAQASGQEMPALSGRFFGYAMMGGLAQILATICVVALFAMRNFAVGITLKKTEVLQTALMGFVLLGEQLSLVTIGGILVGFVAVMFLSDSGTDMARKIFARPDRTAALGLLSGALFGVSGVSYRAASLSLETGDVALRAGLTLAVVTAAQTLAMVVWFAIQDPGQIGKVFRSWRVSALVGLSSMVGSYCWFSAFTLQKAALVNAVGQIELAFSLAASVLFFGEKVSAREYIGIGLLGLSILIIVLAL